MIVVDRCLSVIGNVNIIVIDLVIDRLRIGVFDAQLHGDGFAVLEQMLFQLVFCHRKFVRQRGGGAFCQILQISTYLGILSKFQRCERNQG